MNPEPQLVFYSCSPLNIKPNFLFDRTINTFKLKAENLHVACVSVGAIWRSVRFFTAESHITIIGSIKVFAVVKYRVTFLYLNK